MVRPAGLADNLEDSRSGGVVGGAGYFGFTSKSETSSRWKCSPSSSTPETCRLHGIIALLEKNGLRGGRSFATRRATRGTSVERGAHDLPPAHSEPPGFAACGPSRAWLRKARARDGSRAFEHDRPSARLGWPERLESDAAAAWLGREREQELIGPGRRSQSPLCHRSQHRAACRLVDRRGVGAQVEVIVDHHVVARSAVDDGARAPQGGVFDRDVVVARPALDGAGAFDTQRVVSLPPIKCRPSRVACAGDDQAVVARTAADSHRSEGGDDAQVVVRPAERDVRSDDVRAHDAGRSL